jgi:hypothetical protein
MQKTFCTAALTGAALVVVSPAVLAHHPSGFTSSVTSGPIITNPGTTLDAGSIAAWLAFQYISFDELSDAVLERGAAKDQHVHSLSTIQSPSVGLTYGFTNRLMVSLQLPYVIRTGIREAEHHHAEASTEQHHGSEKEHDGANHNGAPVLDRGNSEGVGDLSVLGQYRFYGPTAEPQLSVLFGVKTPIGATDERDDEGELFETEFQPGSGSWDGLFGLAGTQSRGQWSFDGNILYILATEGAQQTDLGDRLQYNASVSYRILGGSHGNEDATAHEHHHEKPHPHGHTFDRKRGLAIDIAIEISGEWQAKQNIAGEIDPNSGGNVVFLSPGFRLTSNAWSGFVSIGLPVINDLNGVQSEPEYQLLSGLTAAF